jgi:hypothetical protein
MQIESTRRSLRLNLEIPLEVSGSLGPSESFLEETRTASISLHGAKVRLRRDLEIGQRLELRNLRNSKETRARIVWRSGPDEQGFFAYGAEFLVPAPDFWDVDFALVMALEGIAAQVLLQCPRCAGRKLMTLDESELHLLKEAEYLSRYCTHCSTVTPWQLPMQVAR